VTYHAAPLNSAGLAAAFGARRLDDPALQRFLSVAGMTVRTPLWTPRSLALVAVFFRPELDIARATWHEGLAGEITAGGRPQPSAGVSVDRTERPDEGKSTPWSVGLNSAFEVELGGKRGARLARARAVTMASKLRVTADAWRLAGEAATAAAAVMSAHGAVASAHTERQILDTILTLVRSRYTQGAVALTDVSRIEADVQASAVTAFGTERDHLAARDLLARSLGLPLAQVDSLSLIPDSGSSCVTLDTLPVVTLESRALQMRADIGGALAAYAITEADVRLAVAQQYPDATFGPAIGWDQGIGRWTLNLGFARVVVNRNRGPIAEAEARRAGAAARFDQIQQSVLAEVARAGAECGAARRELVAAESLLAGAGTRFDGAEGAFQRGEIGATELAFAQLGLVRARATVAFARSRLTAADVGLDRAVGTWLAGSTTAWPDVTQPIRRTPEQ
jgi:cobalt-zinc-cadmium efflux system outer membrane protein